MFLTTLAFFKAVIVIIFKKTFYCFSFYTIFPFFCIILYKIKKFFQKSGGISNYFYRKKH